MNYAAIYERFIASRRARAAPDGYTEKHHVVPRSLGGADDPSNLIVLTPEDHFFAHLLLAKIHGGKMWVALRAMSSLVNLYTRGGRLSLRKRCEFGHIRRALACHYREVLSGPNGKIADQTRHTLRHLDGRAATGNRFELEAVTGVTRQQISALLRGAKKNAKGWHSPSVNPSGLSRSELISAGVRDKSVLTLHHFDGREWSGTKVEFVDMFGHKLFFQTADGCVAGWYKTAERAAGHDQRLMGRRQAAADARGDISGVNNPRADHRQFRWRVVATGEVIDATKIEVKRRFGLKSRQICTLFSGRQKVTHGIALG